MGYILPIINHTYNDYQKRMIKDIQSVYYVGKPFKIMLDIKHQELKQKKYSGSFMVKDNQKMHQTKRIPEEFLDTKGVYINHYV